MKHKKCTVCGSVKPTSSFYKNKHTKSGCCSECKLCTKARRKIYVNTHPEQIELHRKKWLLANPDYRPTPEQNKRSFKRWYSDPINKLLHAERRKPIADAIAREEKRLKKYLKEGRNSIMVEKKKKKIKDLISEKARRQRLIKKSGKKV